MPLTKQQITAIMRTRGQAHVPASALPYAGRVAEMYTRKKLYRWEDRAAIAQYQYLKDAYSDIQGDAYARAMRYGIDRLQPDATSAQWRREVLQNSEQRLGQLAQDTAQVAERYRSQAYKFGYYARQWLLQSITTPEAPRTTALAQVAEVDRADMLERYQTPVDKTLIKSRGELTGAMQQGKTVRQAVSAAFGAPMGITSKSAGESSGLYHLHQVTTRESVMAASNQGASQAYRENRDVLTGVMFLTAMDAQVCPQCRRMNGFIWPIVDFATAIIGLLNAPPLHYGCRCTLIPIIVPGFGNGDEPPEDGFDDWFFEYGYGDELDPFFFDLTLENTQV